MKYVSNMRGTNSEAGRVKNPSKPTNKKEMGIYNNIIKKFKEEI